ncbi:MAG: MlaA family lipoprotein [Terrimicrobiaceae bacterium]
MKLHPSILPLLLLVASGPFLTSCSSSGRQQKAPVSSSAVGEKKSDGKTVKATDDLDEYSAATIPDPLQPLNRVTFWINDGLYTVLLRPISKGYEFVVPTPVRTGVHNVFENVRFPVRLVNNALQGNFKRAGQETGKFLVNTVVGVGGIGRPSDHIPALADVPDADMGQTFAKWGIPHGAYLVLPVLGPSSLRDTVGMAGDYGLNPVNWVTIIYGGYTWTIAIPSVNSLRTTHRQMGVYDTATKNALDRYLAIRTAYAQYRAEAAAK